MNRFGDIDCSFKHLTPVYGYRSATLVSLEEALQPLESKLEELPFYIKTAKKQCHFPSEHGLTHDESASIYLYRMEWGEETLYRTLNNALSRENRDQLKIWFSYLKLFDSAIHKLPKVKGPMWRGASLDIGQKFSENQLLTWWTVNSRSSSVDVIKEFLGNQKNGTLFMIEALNGRNVSGYTAHEGEKEIILPIGTQLQVKNDPLEQPNNSFLVHLVEINHDEDQQQSLTNEINNLQMKTIEKETKFKVKKWQKNAKTVAGGNGEGEKSNQLNDPQGISIDKNQNIFIADYFNHRIVQWKLNEKKGKTVAGGNGNEERMDQLSYPTDVIVDEENNSLIIADRGHSRVIRWFNQNQQEVLIENIQCWGLAKDKYGFVYVCDDEKNEVRRWKIGEKQDKGELVAGGNGNGSQLNQLSYPQFIFVDSEQIIYVSDCENHRVIKWLKDAKERIVVAGGNGCGENLNQLHGPLGIIVDDFGQIYVVDSCNHRIMRWCEGKEEGEIIVGGNGSGKESNQLCDPRDLSFDVEGNLYVADYNNHRIQRFDLTLE